MGQGETWTVGRLLQWTAEYLQRHGAESPRLDAEVLLAEALHCRRIELYTSFEREPDEATRARFRELVRQRAEGKPVAYLVGRREFYSLGFRVTPDVLIPRPETEHLVVTLLDLAKGCPAAAPVRICDIGTGSGIIAICAAKHLPHARVTAVDISPAALAVAQQNAETHGVAERISFMESDLLAAVPEGEFDFVVSNPPYVSDAELEQLANGVRNYEPRLALAGGPHGTEVITRLVPQAAQRLVAGGYLLIEISPMIHEATRGLLEADSAWELLPTVKDLARLPRVLCARKK